VHEDHRITVAAGVHRHPVDVEEGHRSASLGRGEAVLDRADAVDLAIDVVAAGPVGEALIMTAIGLAVATPAVLGYNYLMRRNKDLQERVNYFAHDLHQALLSGARVATTKPAAPAAAPKKA
jgi:biopolymer transport protein ExbB